MHPPLFTNRVGGGGGLIKENTFRDTFGLKVKFGFTPKGSIS